MVRTTYMFANVAADIRFDGLKVVVDCANGAASEVAPQPEIAPQKAPRPIPEVAPQKEPRPVTEVAPEVAPRKSGGGTVSEVAPESPKKKW